MHGVGQKKFLQRRRIEKKRIDSTVRKSLSLETLSTASLESIPPFPPSQDPNVKHIPTLVYHGPSLLSKSTTSIPTPPRLKSMLKENLSIQRWTESLPGVDAPGHTPWGDFEDRKVVAWIPEGSMYAFEDFQEALIKARRRGIENAPPQLQLQAQSRRSSSHRNALVFEREITLRSDGKTKRWSVQVPAKSMNPEMVDVMLELRNLNSFFKTSSANEMGFEDDKKIHPPILMVSNSHSAIPVSLESAASLVAPQPPSTLATRRGQQNPPCLNLAVTTEKDPYPGIPTAFRGSPSSHEPTFESANNTRSPMSLQEMIDSLRTQCASLQVNSTCEVLTAEASAEAGLTNVLDTEEEDEWAFAHSLLHRYGQVPTDVPQQRTVPPHDTVPHAQEATICYTEQEHAVASPHSLDHSPSLTTSPPEHSRLSTVSQVSSRASIPLSNSSNAPSPRSILKRCKSVRFAESPLNPEVSTPSPSEKQVPRPFSHNSLGSTTHSTKLVKHSSPLRHTYTPQCNDIPLSTKSLVTAAPSLRAAGRQKPCNVLRLPVPTPSPTALSKPKVALNSGPAPKLPSPPSKPRSRSSSPLSQPPKTANNNTILKTRRALTKPVSLPKTQRRSEVVVGPRVSDVPSSANKENNLKGKPSLTNLASRHTLDENAMRRETTPSSDGQKNRVPVPLRNIFKFK
ncbi:hypothetical protein K435DRAFT_892148 [Dendrothele bispora CBS 962.96]|uniref:Uncharacterized protein n=1 Tax=Dendrothele bispora (strain CBS 962.96) TaxID=1314807 RepID=A0A4S8MR36_DENBC|nr:hypothetical protein K435DRAFT_892148 [Dendrothele bispora CBS 962.96]